MQALILPSTHKRHSKVVLEKVNKTTQVAKDASANSVQPEELEPIGESTQALVPIALPI